MTSACLIEKRFKCLVLAVARSYSMHVFKVHSGRFMLF